ncbi:TetR/AcrR family transcriptional regulator [Ferrimonas pelagia]
MQTPEQETIKSTLSRSEKKRADILAAASAEFREKGFAGTSMDALSARAEVSKRTLYNHFSNKEALFEAITGSLWEALQGVPFQPDQPLVDQLKAMARQKMDVINQPDHIELTRCVIGEYMRHAQMAQKAMAKLEQSEDGVIRWFEDAMAADQLRQEDPRFVAHQFYGLLKTFAFFPQMIAHAPAPTPEEQDKIIDSAVTMILAQYQIAP